MKKLQIDKEYLITFAGSTLIAKFKGKTEIEYGTVKNIFYMFEDKYGYTYPLTDLKKQLKREI